VKSTVEHISVTKASSTDLMIEQAESTRPSTPLPMV